MPLIPQPQVAQLPAPQAGPQDLWSGATFYDVTLVMLTNGIIASGAHAPGPLIMQLAVAATAEIMYQTGRWVRPPGTTDVAALTPEAAAAEFRDMGRGK